MKKKINAICVFNTFIDSDNYGKKYEEYAFGYGLEALNKKGQDPELMDFVRELLISCPEEYFFTESLLNDVGYQCVFIEGIPNQNQIDFTLLIDKALNKGFYVTDETNGGIYAPK